MSMIILLAPLISSAWPPLASAILGSVSAMGYSVVDAKVAGKVADKTKKCVDVDVKNSQVIAESIRDKQTITVEKDDVLVSFQKGADDKCKISVMGEGKTDAELKSIGEDIAKAVTQKYVYNRVMGELKQKDFSIVQENIENDKTIRINARRYVS